MKSEATEAEWKALYRAAAEFRAVEPWAWVTEQDIFGVQSPATGDVGYCCIMGELGQFLGMAVYLGTAGLNGHLMVQNEEIEPENSEVMFIQDCLLVFFENKSALEKEDRALIKKLGTQAKGKRAWPVFRRHQPGYFPWFLEKGEIEFLTVALEQAKEVCLRIGKDEDLLCCSKEGSYLVRTYNEDAAQWQDAWMTPELLQEKPHQLVKLDELAIQRIKKNSRFIKSGWEIDFFYSSAPIHEGGRPFYPYTIMIVDKESGFVHDTHLADREKAPAEFVACLLQCIEKTSMIPAELLVTRQEVADLFSLIADKFEIRLRKVDILPALDEARRSLEGHLLQEEAPAPLIDGYCGDDQMEEYLLKAGSNLSIFGLYGLIFGCLSSPKLVMPSILMEAIFEKKGAHFETKSHAQEMIGSIMALWNSLNEWNFETNETPFPCYDYPVTKTGALHRIMDTLSLSQSFYSGLELGGMRLDDLPGELKKDAEQLDRAASLLYSQAKLIEGGKGQDKNEMQKAMKAIENGETVIDECITNIHTGLKKARMQFAGLIGADARHKDPIAFGAKTGRNEPCPCGSGKKYKKCCAMTH